MLVDGAAAIANNGREQGVADAQDRMPGSIMCSLVFLVPTQAAAVLGRHACHLNVQSHPAGNPTWDCLSWPANQPLATQRRFFSSHISVLRNGTRLPCAAT